MITHFKKNVDISVICITILIIVTLFGRKDEETIFGFRFCYFDSVCDYQ